MSNIHLSEREFNALFPSKEPAENKPQNKPKNDELKALKIEAERLRVERQKMALYREKCRQNNPPKKPAPLLTAAQAFATVSAIGAWLVFLYALSAY